MRPALQESEFLALAPIVLRNYRNRRFRGDEMSLPISAFARKDQERVRDLYDFLERLYAVFDRGGNCHEETVRRLIELTPPKTVSAILRHAAQIGDDQVNSHPDELFAKTFHDIRGGGLTFLLGRLQLAQLKGWTIADARTVFFLTRDHLKIMRSALLGLDDAKRKIDQQPKLHGARLIVEKWHNALLSREGRQIRLELESSFDGYVSECCIEFGALDRILYNLINNAASHGAGERIRLTLLELPAAEPNELNENLRFVLENRLSKADGERLARSNPRELFNPGVSTTSSGLGLTVVADFVTNAYGLVSREQAIAEGYLGADVQEDRFIVWFHWPIAHRD